MNRAALVLPLIALLALPAAAFEPEIFVVDPAAAHPGDIVRVTMNMPPRAKGGSATFEGRTIPGFVTGGLLNVYLGIDLDVTPGPHEVRYDFDLDGEGGIRSITVTAKEFATEKLTVESKYTELDEETRGRVERESARLDALWSVVSPARLWSGAFVRPADAAAGSPFGLRRYFNGQPRSPHAGLDLKAPQGAEVYASNAGTVAAAADLFFTGNTVIIDHGLGLYTIYAHLSRIDVEEGKPVARSERIGLVGATGRATGPHLHWGVKLGGARVDPMTLPGMVR